MLRTYLFCLALLVVLQTAVNAHKLKLSTVSHANRRLRTLATQSARLADQKKKSGSISVADLKMQIAAAKAKKEATLKEAAMGDDDEESVEPEIVPAETTPKASGTKKSGSISIADLKKMQAAAKVK